MKHSTILTLLSVFLISLSAKAQTPDSSHYDLGRISISKDLTQSVTIKGADLEKMPFSTLSDAINVWLYGYYGNSTTYVPVVNGMVLTNVDALSIYDIDEITLVQNQAANLSGVAPQQLLLLIKLRKNKEGKLGFTAAAQTNMVKARFSENPSLPATSTTNFYHQYYLSAYTNSKQVSAGLSADFQHDVVPMVQTAFISNVNAFHTNRFKFNGYLDAKMGASTLNVTAGYVPQTSDFGYAYTTPSDAVSAYEHASLNTWYGNVSLNTALSKILHNTFSAGITRTGDDISQLQSVKSPDSTRLYLDNLTFNRYLIKDNLSMRLKANAWTFEPSLNFMYMYGKNTATSYYNGSARPYVATTFQRGSLLTPSLAIRYQDVFELQGGTQIGLSNQGNAAYYAKPQRVYPYASAMVNLLSLTGSSSSTTSWRVYGSYAKVYSFMEDAYATLPGYTFNYTVNAFATVPSNSSSLFSPYFNPYQTFNQWQVGTALSINKRLTFNYTYVQSQFLIAYENILPYLSGYITTTSYPTNKSYTHRLGAEMNLVNKSKFNWRSTISATYVKNRFKDSQLANYPGGTQDINNANNYFITGGFTNRLTYNKAFFGVDAIYIFHDQQYNYLTTNLARNNVFDLQNVYAGYQFTVGKLKNLQLFANARSLATSKQNPYATTRFWGLGFKASI